jgi:SAM-dependent methyltransferase
MGLILDKDSSALYAQWLKSPTGRLLDGFFEEVVSHLLAPQKNERVLDIGCGSGNHLLLLNKLGLDIYGVDASSYMIDVAKKRLGNQCELKVGSAEDLPYSDNEFDYSLLINTLEFLDDPVKGLLEAGRVAKRKVLICVINGFSLHYLGARARGLFDESLLRHIKPYTLWQIKSYVQQTFGAVPVAWKSSQQHNLIVPSKIGESFGWPLGSILGISVTLKTLFKTENIGLKIPLKAKQQVIGEIIVQQDCCL